MGVIERIIRKIRRAPPLTRRERMALVIAELRASGMRIGENVAIYNCVLDTNFPFLIEIGSNSIVTHATILAHDASPMVFGEGVITGPVKVGCRCFVGAGALIMPGVTIGDDCIVGANSVVTSDVPSGLVVAGNPAKRVCSIAEWLNRLKSPKGRRHRISGELDGVVPTEAQTTDLASAAAQAWQKVLNDG
jgi:maltose O-acetyltransferase